MRALRCQGAKRVPFVSDILSTGYQAVPNVTLQEAAEVHRLCNETQEDRRKVILTP